MSVDTKSIEKLKKSYVVGFGLSILLTLLAYFTVTQNLFGQENALGIIMLLAMFQFVVQVAFFLHMGRTSRLSWSDVALYFMILVVVTIIVGSMWIMSNLDYHHGSHESGQSAEEYIIQDEGFDKESQNHIDH